MGFEAFGVNLDELAKAEKAVHDAVAELSNALPAIGSELGGEGVGLKHLLDDGETSAVGHERLAQALVEFGEKHDWGVRFLVDDGNEAASAFRDTRAFYQKVDNEIADMIQREVDRVVPPQLKGGA